MSLIGAKGLSSLGLRRTPGHLRVHRPVSLLSSSPGDPCPVIMDGDRICQQMADCLPKSVFRTFVFLGLTSGLGGILMGEPRARDLGNMQKSPYTYR